VIKPARCHLPLADTRAQLPQSSAHTVIYSQERKGFLWVRSLGEARANRGSKMDEWHPCLFWGHGGSGSSANTEASCSACRMSCLHTEAAELFTSRHCNHEILTFAGYTLPADVWGTASSCLLFPIDVPRVDRAV